MFVPLYLYIISQMSETEFSDNKFVVYLYIIPELIIILRLETVHFSH